MEKMQYRYDTFIRITLEKLWAATTNHEFTPQHRGGGEDILEWKKGSKQKRVYTKKTTL